MFFEVSFSLVKGKVPWSILILKSLSITSSSMTAKRNKRVNRTGVLQQYKKKHGQKRLKRNTYILQSYQKHTAHVVLNKHMFKNKYFCLKTYKYMFKKKMVIFISFLWCPGLAGHLAGWTSLVWLTLCARCSTQHLAAGFKSKMEAYYGEFTLVSLS